MRDPDCHHYYECLNQAAYVGVDFSCDNCAGDRSGFDDRPMIRGQKGMLKDFKKAVQKLPPKLRKDAEPGMGWIKFTLANTIATERDIYPSATHPDSGGSAFIKDWVSNDPQEVAKLYGVSVSAVNSHVPHDSYLKKRWYRREVFKRGRFRYVRKGGRGRPALTFEFTDVSGGY
jgi:hypothetical protein